MGEIFKWWIESSICAKHKDFLSCAYTYLEVRSNMIIWCPCDNCINWYLHSRKVIILPHRGRCYRFRSQLTVALHLLGHPSTQHRSSHRSTSSFSTWWWSHLSRLYCTWWWCNPHSTWCHWGAWQTKGSARGREREREMGIGQRRKDSTSDSGSTTRILDEMSVQNTYPLLILWLFRLPCMMLCEWSWLLFAMRLWLKLFMRSHRLRSGSVCNDEKKPVGSRPSHNLGSPDTC